MDDELAFHVEQRVAELVAGGLAPEAAREEALRRIGDMEALKRACVTIGEAHEGARRRRARLGVLASDARLAARQLLGSPGFAVVAIFTLALGIGANTAIFSVVRGVLLKPLPHRDGDRLVYVRHSVDGPGGEDIRFSVPEVRDLRAGAPSLAGIAEYSSWTAIHQRDDGAARIDIGLVTGNYFEVMGLAPVPGRVTRPADDGPGVPPVMVLTHDYWLRQFGGDSGIVGRSVRLDGRPVTVIGVLQPAPFFPDRIDALLNMVMSDHHLSATMIEGRTHRMTEVVARLAPGATLEQARREVAAVHARMQRDHREAYDPASQPRVAVLTFRAVLGERARLTLWLLMGAAAFVLVIAVANVANLTLMRGVRREPELVVRAALGAGTARLRRLLLAENLVLALAGAGLGVLVAVGGLRLLVAMVERYSPRADEVRLDVVVLGFAIALSVAVCVVLLAGAGLLTRTLIRLSAVDTGLRTEEVLTMQVALLTPTDILSNPEADAVAKERFEHMRREIAALPGVVAAGVGSPMPLRSSDMRFDVKAEGGSVAVGEPLPNAELRTADPHCFRAAGIPLLAGRAFATTDGAAGGRVVIINRALADRLFPNEDPVGKRIAWTGDVLRFTPIGPEWRTVVGVAGNTQDGGLDAAPRPVVFMPLTQFVAFGGGLVIRADSDVARLVPAATRIVRRIAPTAPIENVMTVRQYKDRSVSPRRLNAALVSASPRTTRSPSPSSAR